MLVPNFSQPFVKTLEVPADKSVSHRALIFSAIADNSVRISNFLRAEDCLSTLNCLKALGVEINLAEDVFVHGVGLRGLKKSAAPLNAGNSGTTLRLMSGLLAAQNFDSTFIGDASLSKRPMSRIILPLEKMGATFSARENNFLPIKIFGANLRGINYEMPVASAQVKSAILLAGLYAENPTTVIEPAPSRDHTEKMLAAMGARIEKIGNAITIFPAEKLFAPEKISVAGDISSAAFWIVLATILDGSEITIKNVGVNRTRTGILDVLLKMGAKIFLENERLECGEPVADIKIFSAKLRGIETGGEIIPRMIDEIPILAVAAGFAEGTTIIRDVGELRVKESDRLKAIVEEFNKLSPATFEAQDDILIIHGGGVKKFASCKTYGDHRIAMSLSIMGMATEGVDLDDGACVKISYPNFFDMLK